MSPLDDLTLDAVIELVAERIAERVSEKLDARAPAPAAVPELMTLREAAKHLRSSEGTIRRRILAGELASVRHGKRILVHVADVQALIARAPVDPPLSTEPAPDEVERALRTLRSAS